MSKSRETKFILFTIFLAFFTALVFYPYFLINPVFKTPLVWITLVILVLLYVIKKVFKRVSRSINYIQLFFIINTVSIFIFLSPYEAIESSDNIFHQYTNKKGWLVLPSTSDVIYITKEVKEMKLNKTYINSDGFRSKEFDSTACGSQPKVLFLGDSFTYGYTVSNYNKAFVELVDTLSGFCTYNASMPLAELPQYHSMAKEIIPKIKPNVVCLMLCEENDMIDYEREVSENKPLGYPLKNGSLLLAYNDNFPGQHLTFEKVREYYYREQVISHQIFEGLRNIFIWSNLEEDVDSWSYSSDCFYTAKYINAVKEISENNGAKFLLFIIPNKDAIETNEKAFRERYHGIFDSLTLHIPKVTLSDYSDNYHDKHFDEDGHATMAKFIIETLNKDIE